MFQSPQRSCALVFSALVILGSLAFTAADNEWRVPSSATEKKNPIPADKDSLAAGKKIYAAECLECHGKTGRGDGPGVKDLVRRPPDLASKKIQDQSDGALFYKITQGRKEMPAYRKLLKDDQRWQTVLHLRTLAPAATASGDQK